MSWPFPFSTPAGTARGAAVAAFAAWVATASPAHAQFTDRTVAAGLLRLSTSWGAALADVDGDGFLDLYAGHHIALPLLYWNQGNGTLSWLAHPQPWSGPSDRHGALLLPLDGDELPDLFITHGGGGGASTEANELYRNDGGASFSSLTGAGGLDDPAGRTRCASAADFDGDLRVDVWIGKAPRAITRSSLFRNDADLAFVDVAASVDLDEAWGTVGGIWGDVDDDGDPDLLVGGEEFARPTILWRNDGGVFHDDSAIFSPPLPVVSGADWGDFDLDGDLDLAACDGTIGEFDTWAEGDTVTFYFNTRYADDGVDALTVPSSADTLLATFDYVGTAGPAPIRLGPAAVTPPAGSPIVLTDAYVGAPSFVPGTDLGIYVWRTASGGAWEIRCSTPNLNYDEFSGRLWDGTTITGVAAANLEDPAFPSGAPRVWRNDGGAFTEVSAALGLPAAMVNPRDISWVDFDNDGDPDLHVVDMGTSAVPNAPDALFRNDGTTLTDVTAAEGVAGGTGGLGDGAVWGDVDNDGDPDLYLKQGAGSPLYSYFGPALYLRNDGQRGNAIQLDLVGAAPNPSAVGAVVDVVAGGLRIRRRVTANSWRGFQDPLRIHAGIGNAALADTVRITWPSGTVHEYTNVAPGVRTVREDTVVLDSAGPHDPPRTAFRVEGPFPQPARGAQQLAVTLPRGARLTVSVHDVAGRLIRRLHDGPVPAGATRFSWNGTGADGVPVAAGVYFLRVRGEGAGATVRSVRIR